LDESHFGWHRARLPGFYPATVDELKDMDDPVEGLIEWGDRKHED